jgi:hypothetical protein
MSISNEPNISVTLPVLQNQVTTGVRGQLPGSRQVVEFNVAGSVNAQVPRDSFVNGKRTISGGEPPISLPRTDQGFVASANNIPQIATKVSLGNLTNSQQGVLLTGAETAPDDAYRGIGPLGARADPAGMVWNGIPMEPPPQFQSVPNFENLNADRVASQIALGSDSAPDQRAKHTITISKEAAQLSSYELKSFVLVAEVQNNYNDNKHQGYAQPNFPSNVYSITDANLVMALNQKKPENPYEVTKVAEIMQKFRIIGVCETDSGNYEGPLGPRRAAGHRNVVVTLAGITNSCFNIWPRQLFYGQWLGFILKGVPKPEIFVDSVHNNGTYQLDPRNPQVVMELPQDTPKVLLQYVPWCGATQSSTMPETSELVYLDDFGVERMGVFIPFGRFMQYHKSIGDLDDIERAINSKSAAVSAGSVIILLSPKMILAQSA